jgi:uncharacterized membrane protein
VSERGPAIGMVVAAAVLGVLGYLVTDERARALLWILAIPMALSGLAVVAWGNASRQVERYRKDKR